MGKQKVSETSNLTARFKVPYEVGELRAVGIRDGKDMESKTLRTTGLASSLKLTPDRNEITSDRNDLAYISVEITDESGATVPDATVKVDFEVLGEGSLIAVENGKPDDMKSLQSPYVTSHNGRCLAIIRPSGKPGEIRLKAVAEGIGENEVVIMAE